MSVVALDSRRQTLGGSTIAAACGVDPYTSPIRLWLAMTGRVPVEENEAMTWGRRLQPLILDGVRNLGYSIRDLGVPEYRDPELPWLVGHPDALGFGPDDGTVFEAKASARGYDAVPVHYEAQVQTYMHLTGLDSAVLATLAGLHLTVHEIERRQHVIDVMLTLAERFMEYVRTDTQPPPQGHADDRAALALAWPEQTPGKLIRETREIQDARRELVKVMEQGKAVKAREEALRATITDFMRDAETLISMHDEPVATWKRQTSWRCDTTQLKKKRPDVWGQFATETPTRVLRFK